MAQKPNSNKRSGRSKQSGSMNGAIAFFAVGCVAEFFLLMVRQFFINGNINQVVAWNDQYLPALKWVGLAALVLGAAAAAALTAAHRRGWLRWAAWAVCGAGAFVAAVSILALEYMDTALMPLCVVVPVVVVLGVLWNLYDRECTYALTVLGLTALVLWACRKGVGTVMWGVQVRTAAILYLIVMAAATRVFRKAEKTDNRLGRLQLLPKGADPMPVYASCAASVLVVAASLFSAAVAYYAMWAVGILVFLLAVYYTVRQL